MAWDRDHGDVPAARAAPAGRHADYPFPVKAFYIGARLCITICPSAQLLYRGNSGAHRLCVASDQV